MNTTSIISTYTHIKTASIKSTQIINANPMMLGLLSSFSHRSGCRKYASIMTMARVRMVRRILIIVIRLLSGEYAG